MYCNPCSITEHLQTTTEKSTYLCTATPDLTEQLHTTEKMIHLSNATPDVPEQLHTQRKWFACVLKPLIWLKNIPVQHLISQRTCVLPSPGMTKEHPNTTPEKCVYLCVAFPWYDWRTSQCNTWEVSVPVCCLPPFPRCHCRSMSASRRPSRRSLHLGWQTNWWRQESLKETDQKTAFSPRGAFTWRRWIVEGACVLFFPCFSSYWSAQFSRFVPFHPEVH